MNRAAVIVLVAIALSVSACAERMSEDSAQSNVASAAEEQRPELPKVVAFRSPTCGCCELWVEHMRAAGFEVEVVTTNNVQVIKSRAGVPAEKSSCHTAKVGDYYLEGHVPSADVKRLLAEKPSARGLIVPGMVPGSPGMEQGGVSRPYDVLLLASDGTTTVYSHHAE